MQVFLSYSHKDTDWKERLMPHLQLGLYGAAFELWDDTRIQAGEQYEREITKAVRSADAAVLLVSANSLTSKYILQKEVPAILERHEAGDLIIVPVYLKPCPYKRVKWLKPLQMQPSGKALSGLSEAEADRQMAAIASDLADRLAPSLEETREPARSDPLPPEREEHPKPRRNVQVDIHPPLIAHNMPVNGMPGMHIQVNGVVRHAAQRTGQLAVRFFLPNGQPLMASPQEMFYRDTAGAVLTYGAEVIVPSDPFDFSGAAFVIPYFALNLAPTGGMMQYQLNAVAEAYVDRKVAAQSVATPMAVFW